MGKTRHDEAVEREIQKMTDAEKRVDEWTESLMKDQSDENIMSFMYDTCGCSSGMFPRCVDCPYICFKKFVLWNIGFESNKISEHIENRMVELSRS